MSTEGYQDLIDARDSEAAMRALAAGTLRTLSGDDVEAYLAQLENGRREGSVSIYQWLTRPLGLSVAALLPDEPGQPAISSP